MQINVIREFVLSGHSGPLYTLLSRDTPEGILAGGSDGVISFWPAGSDQGQALARCEQAVFCLQWLVTDHLLLAGTQAGILYWIDVRKRDVIRSLKVSDRPLFDIRIFEADILVSDGGGCIHSNAPDGNITRSCFGTSSIRCMTGVGDRLLAGNSDGRILSWLPETGIRDEVQAHRLSVFRLLPWNDLLFTAGRDAHINCFTLGDLSPHMSVPAHMFAINDLVLPPSLGLLFSGSMDKTVKIWSPQDLTLLKVLDHDRHGMHRHGINRLAWAHDRLYTCGDDRNIMVWKIEAGS